ncbi:tyrosine-type recombinase/integrase [Bradyrhizobium sp. IC3123]|uniref:tyrosine-type recombinase/integrase n=1 Tax=Bradyrhizobium sp. IC3123 TaxID=2793803 RepID=UPI001CD459AC|nr:tyrosine-type recombinase/integrase [Bradyrhizobium sp. IC3123]MCA1390765.1 tyrosine-type recombinase/integrase [Bradyrhizobium sp. IC3123]
MRYLKQWKQDGNWRIRFRRPGYKPAELPVPPGYRGDKATLANSKDFLTAYLAAMAEPVAVVAPGEARATYGTVGWLCGEYLGSLDYTGRPQSMKDRHKRYIEEFREKYGDLIVKVIEQETIEKIFAKMIDQPSRANQWLDAMRDLFKYAIKRKLLVVNPALDIKKRKPKLHVGENGESEEGHLTWPVTLLEQARQKFPVGTKMRLAIEMINALAFRRSDVIRVGPPNTYEGRLEDGRSATFLKYTQHKNRERKPITVDTPIPAELLDVIKKTKATGLKTWLVGARSGSFATQGFTDSFADEWAKAGLPPGYTPHGLRKRCLTDLANDGKTIHQIQAISGHLTSKEVERYTKMADRARNARAAMAGRV